jgi:hypothetical protein
MDTIKFPCSFDATGYSKLEEGSYDYYKQLLTVALLTQPGDNPLTPQFGVNDSSFQGFDGGLFIYNAARYVPEVEIKELRTTINERSGQYSVIFSFDIRRAETDAN